LGCAIEHVRDLAATRRHLAIALLVALAGISVEIQVLSVSTDYSVTENAVIDKTGIPAAQISQVVARRANHMQWTWAGSPLHQAMILARRRPTVLHWFEGRRRLTGILLLVDAIALTVVAAAVALRAERTRLREPSVG
jgi:hypothetical protein